MPRATTKKLYRTFVKGLVTEASPLTYPENASIDEDNCIIYKKGNRTRRYGADAEPGTPTTFATFNKADINSLAFQEYIWESVNKDANVNFLCHQIGVNIYFYSLATQSLGEHLQTFTIDLTPYITPSYTLTQAQSSAVQMSGGKGYLFVVGPCLEPILVEYDPGGSLEITPIYIQIRDFKGVDDGLANDAEPTTLSAEHEYNLLNQGWDSPVNDDAGAPIVVHGFFGNLIAAAHRSSLAPPYEAYFTAHGRYPPNSKQWWISKDEDGLFDPDLLVQVSSGNTRAPRGHYVVNAFNIDRSGASAVTGIPNEVTIDRPNCVSFMAGRAWYGINSTVYFSQVLDDKRRAGMCYQEADPTSEDISDLVATDGGVIPIPEAASINRLVPQGGGLLVFATNGVWFITGTSNGFTALDFSVSKVASIGTESPLSIVVTSDKVFYWSPVGIQGIAQKSGMFGPIQGGFDQINVTTDTIQTFYNDEVSEACRPYVKGAFDSATDTIQWLFRDDTETDLYVYNRILNFDIGLGAFYPWSISRIEDDAVYNGPKICGFAITKLLNDMPLRASYFKYITVHPRPSGPTVHEIRFSLFNNETFADWTNYDSVGVGYESFVETGYELLEDAMRDKQSNYVFCYFRRTEDIWVEQEDGSFIPRGQSSCLFTTKWDWASSQVSNKWSREVEAYRHVRFQAPDETDLTYDTGFPIVVTRNKVRGSGRAIQFRFSCSEINKNFDLLGWSVTYSGNTEV